MKTFDIRKYDNLQLPDAFKELAKTPEGQSKLLKCFNGVGSQEGWFNRLIYHFIPDTILLLNVTACSDIHDAGYTYPDRFKTRADALAYKAYIDLQFRENLETYISMKTSNPILLNLRLKRAMDYYTAVSCAGDDSFLEGKTFEHS